MSRKSLRNASRHASKRTATIGLSSLALGSVTVGLTGLLHAQNAQPAQSGDTTSQPKAGQTAAKSNRWRAVRLASSAAAPATGGGSQAANGTAPAANGAGMVAQNSPAATAAGASNVPAPAGGAAASANELQEIVVTGIRGSLERALQIKKLSLGVVDAVSAEDIGQFPDSSIGESIGRIPGVTVNRGSINQMTSAGAPTATGAVTGVTVRGFGTQFNELLVEGRPVASGNGQSFDFSTMSANYIGEIDVHKTPDFSLSSGAIGATINVKFPNPFDNPGPHAQGFVEATDYENDGAARPAFGGLLSDTFADGKFGILIDGDYTDHHILGHHQDIVGWKAEDLPCSSLAANYSTVFGNTGCAATGSGASGNAAVQSWYPQDMAMYLERTDSRRKDGRLALQWHPNDNVLVTVDDNYSSDNERTERYQRSTWFGAFPNATLDSDSVITSFDYTGPTDFNSFIADNYIVTNTPGVNITWDVNDDWTAELDASQSASKLNPNGNYTDVDVDTGYGDNLNQYTGGLTLSENPNVLPYWSALGPNAVAAGSGATISPNYLGLNPFIVGSHVVVLQDQQNSDKVNQVKLDATWHHDSMKLDFGAQFVDDLWNTKEMDTLTNNYWELWSGYGPASGNTSGVTLPSSFFTPVGLGTWMPGYSGAGNLPSSMLEYNPWTVLNYLLTQPVNADQNAIAVADGYPAYTSGIPAMALNPNSVQHVDRKNYSPFLTAEQNFDLGDMTLKADLGLRYQKTKEEVAGINAPLTAMIWSGAGDPTAYSFVTGTKTWTTANESYGYFLPSLDLNLMVTPNFKVRADFSRTETPPNDSQVIPTLGTPGGRVNALNVQGNNPGLLPYLADNYDLGAEWYYASNDYVSVDGFFKHVTQFPVSTVENVTFPGIIDPAPCTNPATGAPLSNTCNKPAVFAESTIVNGGAANVTGVEATWQQMLVWGFGFQINGTYVHSNAAFNPYTLTASQFALPGIGNSANFVGFYQAHGLQARLTVQWQAAQLLSLFGQEQNGGSYAPEPVNLASSTEVDYSMQYDFTPHLSGYFEALNLTDAVYHTYGRFRQQTLNLVDYGRSYTMGVRLKF